MKKIVTTLLAITMMTTMSMTAFAAELPHTGTGDYEIDISANYQPGEASDEIISVDISWGAMEFTYHEAADGQWSPSEHQFTGGTEAHWDANGNSITVVNHSNTGVKAVFSYTGTVTTVTGSFNHELLELPTAVGTTYDAAPAGATTLTLGGTLEESAAGKVGTVTISISKNE